MFKVTESHNKMKCLEIQDAPEELHTLLRQIVGSQFMNDQSYIISKAAGAFFQSGFDRKSGYVLIEFWLPNGAEAFVNYVEEQYKALQETVTLSYTQIVQLSCMMTDNLKVYQSDINKLSQADIEYNLIKAIRKITKVDFFEIERTLSK